ncbi:uncharacterized protein JCM15063_000826 [Sporobolomyces koalae]|uniref:uncharacterized protein n=1 Tax=Sporobolomyces koalae TaxID=500713 RepID=UPI00316ED20A
MSDTFTIDGQESWPRPGYGAMGLSAFYGPTGTDEEGKQVLRKAIEVGCTFWNTADMYGQGHNEKIIGEVLREGDNRSKVFLVTKFGNRWDAPGVPSYKVDGSPEYAIEAIKNSIERMGGIYPDAWILHRIDKATPIEESVRAMDAIRKEGKCKYIGLSECSAETLRRAAKVAKISFVEVEYSPWTLDMEQNGVLDACKELGITVLAYSPLGRGKSWLLVFLEQRCRYKQKSDFSEGDWRAQLPRLSQENWDKNYKIVEELEKLATKKHCTAGQLSLAWLLAQGPNIVPIPGTKSEKYLVENFDSRKIELSESDLRDIRQVIVENAAIGDRYSQPGMASLDQ